MKNFREINHSDYKEFIKDIVRAKKSSSLFCFVGAGTSISQGFPNWNEYVDGLIDYWSYHLGDIVTNPKTKFSQVKASDRRYLQWLKTANYSKERKVDLVHEVISEYSQCDNKNDSALTEQKYIHQYEQAVFIDTEPMLKENKILNELVNLRPIFITTNYDEQIERACLATIGLKPTVYSSIDKYHGEKLITDDVIHLHGMPKSIEDVFISSSQSYLKMYNERNQYREQIKKLFASVKDPLIIFVGSSLQEDEVLHFLDVENIKIRKYAIMLFQTEGNELDNVRSIKLKTYYLNRQGISLIWYEKSFDDLPDFLKQLNRDVDLEFSKEIVVSEKDLKSKVDNKENPIPGILKAIANQEFMIVDEFLGTLKEYSVLNDLMKNDEFLKVLKGESNQLLGFWNNVVENFDKLSLEAQKNAFQIVKAEQSANSKLANLMISISLKFWKKYSTSKKCYFLKNNIEKYLTPYIRVEVPDDTVKCLYLIAALGFKSSYPIAINTDQRFNFDQDTYLLLSNELQEIDKTGIFYSSWESIKDRQAVRILFDLCKKGNIRYLRRKDFPANFYTYKIVQKILVNVDLADVDLTQKVRNKLFSKIDWNFKSIGKEFNEINRKYMLNPAKESNYFQDGIANIGGAAREIDQLPFFEINIEKDIKTPSTLLNNLANSIGDTSKINWDDFTEKSLSGQNNELVKKLCDVNLWSNYSREYLSVIIGLFENIRMYKSFDYAIGNLINFGLENNLPKIDEIIMKYIEFLERHLELAFTYPNDFSLWEKILECKNVENEKIYQFLFKKVEINKLNLLVPKKDYFDMQDYMQTEFLNYCYVLTIINESDKTVLSNYMPQLLKEINKADISKRQVFKGIFFNSISSKDDEKYSKLSLYFFIKFHNGINKEIYCLYKKSIESLLKETVNDLNVINFITATILRYEQPTTSVFTLITHSSFRSQIYRLTFDLYWESDGRPKYATQWVNQLILEDKIFISQSIRTIIKYIRDEEVDKTNSLINILKSSNIEPNYKLREEDFIIMTFVKECSREQLKKTVELIRILCEKGYMHVTKLIETEIEITLNKLQEYNLETKSLLESLKPYTRVRIFNEWNRKYGC